MNITSFLNLFHPVTLFVSVLRPNLQFYQIGKKEIDTSKYRKSCNLVTVSKKIYDPCKEIHVNKINFLCYFKPIRCVKIVLFHKIIN